MAEIPTNEMISIHDSRVLVVYKLITADDFNTLEDVRATQKDYKGTPIFVTPEAYIKLRDLMELK